MNLRFSAAILLLGALLAVSACSSRPQVQQHPVEDLYALGLDYLERGNYTLAIAHFEAVEARFPFSNEARQAVLNLIYAYYKNGDTTLAIDAANQFIRENPTHARVDYALYMQGLTYFGDAPGWLNNLFGVDLDEHPPNNALRSYLAFYTLVLDHPGSEYAADSRERMVYLRNRLAAYEVFVARQYLQRQAYTAAINRARYMLENYAGAPQQREALEIMLDAYQRLGMTEMANNTRAVLQANWPGEY